MWKAEDKALHSFLAKALTKQASNLKFMIQVTSSTVTPPHLSEEVYHTTSSWQS